MTQQQKELCQQLIEGCFLRKTVNFHGTAMYKLFDAAGNPVRYYRKSTVDAIDKYERLSLFKGDPKVRMTLNLSQVRQLHGKRILKQLYKKHQKQQ